MLTIKVIGLAAFVSVGLFACNPAAQTNTNQTEPAPPAQTQSESQNVQGADLSDNQGSEAVGDTTDSSAGDYVDYSQSSALSAAENGDAVLFFHATWCPTCRAADKEINSKISSIPPGLTILKTDYDIETELKKKYGVVGQHTFVHIDANSELISKWSGGGLQDVVDNI